jgi:hypothetical protein
MMAKSLIKDDTKLTVEALKGVMPKRQKHNITQPLVDELNQLVSDPDARDQFRDNFISYTSVLNDSKVRLPTYIDAVKYVSYKMMGHTNQEAWMKTFPARYQRLLKLGKDATHIRATVACYNRNKVVAEVYRQSIIPTWIVNNDVLQRAINIQANLMCTAKSEKVRTEAANSLMNHLKQPETSKLQLDVNVKQDDSIKELRDATMELVKAQKLNIESGAQSVEEIAKSRLIEGSCEVIEDE